ncbi:NADH-quinone oxidoreductase subunit D-related protein [Acetobacter nitrogenifigens]|uniref:NADH-quinone oxidoreductase subunit D-related protein n=1 Tax=Acetobacter nitrogenifigens TaxID=285268 RepID=UPI0004138D6B|nr:hypothetical protein [Acetobacter nitrogenifigens]
MNGGLIPFGAPPKEDAEGLRDSAALIRSGRAVGASWRFELDEMEWRGLQESLSADPLSFIGLWCDGDTVQALFADPRQGGDRPLMAVLKLDGARYPGLSGPRPAAASFERRINDLWGVEAMDARDTRPLVDHAAWTASAPLSARPGAATYAPEIPEFGQLPDAVVRSGTIATRGPANGGFAAPAHLLLGVAPGPTGPAVASVESRVGYTHRGVASRMCGGTALAAADLAGRISVSMAAAHQWAFCMAAERAAGVATPLIAEVARAALCEIERVSAHLTALARLAQVADAALVSARLFAARETLMRFCGKALGKRTLMDCICPGGVAIGGAASGGDARSETQVLAWVCQELAAFGRSEVAALRGVWRTTPGLLARLAGLGMTRRAEMDALGLGGVVGRACGRGGDLRLGQAAYGAVQLRPCARTGGDARARADLRIDEILESLELLDSLGATLLAEEADALCAAFPTPVDPCWGFGAVEAAHGAVWYVVGLGKGRVEQVFIADPSPSILMAQEAALVGARALDVDVVTASFGVSAAAVDQ